MLTPGFLFTGEDLNMKKLALLLILAGLIIALYPLAERAYTWYWQQRLMAAWEESQPETGTDYGEEVVEEPAEELLKPRVSSPLGMLSIDKISLEMPVLRGATETNLRLGVGLLEAGAEIGARGTVVLTAHRSHTRGRQFNRLDELDQGDEIIITTRSGMVYKYEVFQKEIVSPDQITVQRGEGSETTLALVTCHPLYSVNPPYRMVVRARQIEPVVEVTDKETVLITEVIEVP